MTITKYLADNGITKAELARRIGKPKQSINVIFDNPKESTAREIAKALGISIWELYFISEAEAANVKKS